MKHEAKRSGESRHNDYQHDVFVVDWACVDKKENK